jgi:hypothetical protein
MAKRHDRNGIAVLLVLAVIAITLALAYALSRSSTTMAQISAHERFGLEARAAVDSSVGPPLNSLRANPNWMPHKSPVRGALATGEHYQVGVQMTEEGAERAIGASAQVFDLYRAENSSKPNGSANSTSYPIRYADSRPLAEQHLTINLAKQPCSDLPTAAITAFATTISKSTGAPIYIANGNTVRGNVRSRGPIQFQAGFVLKGTPHVMGNVSRTGTGPTGYQTYRASWGTSYHAESLAEHGRVDSAGRLVLENVVLGPTSENPMGVYYYSGTEVVLGDNVQVTGTIAIRGNLRIVGTGVHLIAVQQTKPPPSGAPPSALPPGLDGKSLPRRDGKLLSVFGGGDPPVAKSVDIDDESGINTSFPTAVVSGSIVFDETADVVRVSGLLLAGQNVQRLKGTTATLVCSHDHSLSIEKIANPLGSVDGPAIYIRGAIMAARISLQHRSERPLALVFDSAVTDVRDAPGFFTWRVTEWTEAN